MRLSNVEICEFTAAATARNASNGGNGGRCEECDSQAASVQCMNCEQHMCRGCSDRLHAKGARARHEIRSLANGQPIAGSGSGAASMPDLNDQPAVSSVLASRGQDLQSESSIGTFERRLQQQLEEAKVDQANGTEDLVNRYAIIRELINI